MPRDMAMQRPHARIIGLELEHQVARQELCSRTIIRNRCGGGVATRARGGDVCWFSCLAGTRGIRGREGEVPARLQQLRVSALGVHAVDAPVPVADAFGYDPEVVAVEVHGVGSAGDVYEVAQDDADGWGRVEVVDVPFWVVGVGGVAEVGEKEERVAVL